MKTSASSLHTSALPNGNWVEELSKLDINTVHNKRSCQVFFMAEIHEVLFPAIEKFYRASKVDKQKTFKCISYEDIVANITRYSSSKSSSKSSNDFYTNLATEANVYLNNEKLIPCFLMALLVKMEIIQLIHQDILDAQKLAYLERSLEEQRISMKSVSVAAQTKGKGKKKSKSIKSTSSHSSKKKGKTKAETYDVCNPKNVLKFKKTSKLLKLQLPLNSAIDISSKLLIFVIVGFYDVELIKELYNLKVQITALVEVSKSCPKKSSSVILKQTSKTDLIEDFWNKIEDICDSNSKCPNYLNNSFHMTVDVDKPAIDVSTLDDVAHCAEVFTNITKEILKYEDVQRQYANYIRHLKNFNIVLKARKCSKSQFELYHKLMAYFPPECSIIFSVMYAMGEDVINRFPNIHIDTDYKTSIDYSLTSKGSVSIRNQIFLNECGEWNIPIKVQTAHILKNLIQKKSTVMIKEISNPKINVKLSETPFLVDENNEIEILISSYKSLYSKLISIYLDKLVKCKPILLWKKYPENESKTKECLNARENIHSIAQTLDLGVDEIQYIIHTFLFTAISCQSNILESVKESIDNVHKLFPPKPPSKVIIESIDESCFFEIEPLEKPRYNRRFTDPYIPHLEYSNMPSVYEAKNMCAYKWHEPLTDMVMIQELYKANRDYLCMDHIYCKYDDSILLRFHNNTDNFGISCKAWNAVIRTVVNIREFCEYIINENSKWLVKQEEKYRKKIDTEFKSAIDYRRLLKKEFYPDFDLTMYDFIQKGSLKAKLLQEVEEENKKERKNKIKVKSDSKKSKSLSKKGSSKIKNRDEKYVKTSHLLILEKLAEPVVPPRPKKLSLLLKDTETPHFHSYDISNRRFQLTGSTIVFHSQDGYKVTVDTSHFAKESNSLSLNVSLHGNNLILHYNKYTLSKPFTFHFALADFTFINFFKPFNRILPEEKLCQKICQKLKKEKSNTSVKRQQLYFIHEKQLSVIKCFNIPYITKRNLILSEELLIPFLEKLKLRGISLKLEASASLSTEEMQKFNDILISEDSYETGSITEEDVVEEHRDNRIAYEIGRRNSKPIHQYQEIFNRKKQFSDILLKNVRPELTTKMLLKKIRKTMEAQMPIFKICSSPLHKRQYVKRIKSHMELQIGNILKKFKYKPRVCTSKVNLEISKLLPIAASDKNDKKSQIAYHTKASLPSGLYVETIAGTGTANYNIRQKYLDKGPQCKNIVNEYSRTFTQTGDIMIKDCDGNIEVLNVHGRVVKCEVPTIKFGRKKSIINLQKTPDVGPVNIKSLTKFQKHLLKRIKRYQKRIIGNYKSQHLMSHRACLNFRKKIITDKKQIYMIQESIAPLTRFSLITSNGNQLKVVRSVITESSEKYYTTSTVDYRYEEILFEREDGVKTKTNKDSSLVTQFPDGTRITTWIDIEQDLLYVINLPNSSNEFKTSKQQQTDFKNSSETTLSGTSSDHRSISTSYAGTVSTPSFQQVLFKDKEEVEGWVSVFLNYKYEHFNYATVIFYGRDSSSEIILPNNVTITSTELGEYVLNIYDNICTKITTEQIFLEARLCNNCLQKSVVDINVKPLYYYNKNRPIVESCELLKTIDSFNKIFKINYNGHCFKNLKFHNSRINLAQCKAHYIFETQKLFVLKRCLIGCRLWDINSYKLRLGEANKSEDVVVKIVDELQIDHPRTEVRTYIRVPRHNKFCTFYEEPFLMLSKNRVKINVANKVAYVTRQFIIELPEVEDFYFIFLKFVEICSELNLKWLKDMELESQTFLNQMVDLGLSVHSVDRKAFKNSFTDIKDESDKEIVTFKMRYEERLKKLQKYKKEYQERYVPTYFDKHPSKLELIKKLDNVICDEKKIKKQCKDEQEIIAQIVQVYNVNITTQKVDMEFSKFSSKPSSLKQYDKDTISNPIQSYQASRGSGIQFSKEELIRFIANQKPSNEGENKSAEEILRVKAIVANQILSETINNIIKMAVKLPLFRNVTASNEKVTKATKILLDLMSKCVTFYELSKSQEEYVNKAVSKIMKTMKYEVICNAVEWVLISDNLNQKNTLDNILKCTTSQVVPSERESCNSTSTCRNNVSFPEKLYLDENAVHHQSGFDLYSSSYCKKNNKKLQCFRKLKQVDEDQSSKSVYSKTKSEADSTNTVSTLNFDIDDCDMIGNSISEVVFNYEKLPPEKFNYLNDKISNYSHTKTCPICEDSCGHSYKQDTGSISTRDIIYSSESVSSSVQGRSSISKNSQSTLPTVTYLIDENEESMDSRTTILSKSVNKSESLKVLYSVSSLKNKLFNRRSTVPYVQCLPNEGIENIIQSNNLHDQCYFTRQPDVDVKFLDPILYDKSVNKQRAPNNVDAQILDEDVQILNNNNCFTLCTVTPAIIPFQGPWRKSRGDQTEENINDHNSQTPSVLPTNPKTR